MNGHLTARAGITEAIIKKMPEAEYLTLYSSSFRGVGATNGIRAAKQVFVLASEAVTQALSSFSVDLGGVAEGALVISLGCNVFGSVGNGDVRSKAHECVAFGIGATEAL